MMISSTWRTNALGREPAQDPSLLARAQDKIAAPAPAPNPAPSQAPIPAPAPMPAAPAAELRTPQAADRTAQPIRPPSAFGGPAPAPAPAPEPAPAPAPAPVPSSTPPTPLDAAAEQRKAAAALVTPVAGTFDNAQGAAGRVEAITRAGSPLMQLAETRALEAANARGLLNSSMAVGAGQRAVIETATPLAVSDAEGYQRQQLLNQQEANTAARQNANTQAGQNLTELQSRLSSEQQLRMADVTNQQQVRMAGLNSDAQVKLATLENTWRQDLQANEKLSAAWSTMMTAINNIQMNSNLDGPAKTTMVQQALDQFGTYAKWTKKLSGVDVSDLLTFSTAPPQAAGANVQASGSTAAPSAAPAPSPAQAAQTAADQAYWNQYYYNQGG